MASKEVSNPAKSKSKPNKANKPAKELAVPQAPSQTSAPATTSLSPTPAATTTSSSVAPAPITSEMSTPSPKPPPTSTNKTSQPPPASLLVSKLPKKPTLITTRIRTLYDNLPTDLNLPMKLREMEESVVEKVGTKAQLEIRYGHDAYEITSTRNLEEEIGELPQCLEDHNEEIVKAKESIALKAAEKILPNDVVMIYGYSDVIKEILVTAVRANIKFSLVIIESGAIKCRLEEDPDFIQAKGLNIHALHLMKKLGPEIQNGVVRVIHTQISGLTFVIRKVTKLFLSAYALLTNGGIMGKIGTSQIALMAYTMNIPVVVCCETFKFCDRVPTDSFFSNERGLLDINLQTTEESAEESSSKQQQEEQHEGIYTKSPIPVSLLESTMLKTPSIKFDITPARFVTAVITEVDIFPATSIPLLLRVQDVRNKKKKEELKAKAKLGSAGIQQQQHEDDEQDDEEED